MKRSTVIISLLLLVVAISAFAQDSTKNYWLLGKIKGSTCPVCDNYVQEILIGAMTLEELPVACPACAAYRILSLKSVGQSYKIELGEDGGMITFAYGNPTAMISLDLLVNGYEVSLRGEGNYWKGMRGWPIFCFPSLSDWIELGFVAFPTLR